MKAMKALRKGILKNKNKAGVPLTKKPATATGCIKPALKKGKPAGMIKGKPVASKAPLGGSTAGGASTKIHQPSLSIVGGKNQCYIQHQPNGANTPKRLVVACTLAQAAKLKIGHKQVMEEILPYCKAPGATKGDALAARETIFRKYAN